MVLLDDSLGGFERNTPHFLHFEQLFAPQLIQNMAACGAGAQSYAFFLFTSVLCFTSVFLFYLRGFFFACVVSIYFAWFHFYLRGSFFACVVSFFVCVVFFVFACFLFCLRGFLLCLRGFFLVCSVSLVGHHTFRLTNSWDILVVKQK